MSSVDVDTDNLPTVYDSQVLNGHALGSAISMTMAPATPAPAAMDVVSQMIARTMSAFAPTFFEPTSTAIGHLTNGAHAVLQAGVSYRATDVTGGGDVRSRDHF